MNQFLELRTTPSSNTRPFIMQHSDLTIEPSSINPVKKLLFVHTLLASPRFSICEF